MSVVIEDKGDRVDAPSRANDTRLVTVDTHYQHGLFGLEGEHGKAMNAKAAE
jgi:hypothetical protein